MNFPKLVIASNGRITCALLDGVFLGKGIQRLDFSTQNEDGKMKSTIRILDLDVKSSDLSGGKEQFDRFLESMAEKSTEPAATGTAE